MDTGQLFPIAGGVPCVPITNLAYATSQVTPGSLFFCVRGFTRDGHAFAPKAIANGAAALVVDHPLNLGVPEVVVENVREAMAPAAALLQPPHQGPEARRGHGYEWQDDDVVPRWHLFEAGAG